MSAGSALTVRDGRSRAQQPTIRRLAVAWQHPVSRSIQPVGLLQFDGATYKFSYISHIRNVTDFRPLVGFPDLSRRYESPRLFPLFAQRVMDPRRSDYSRYVARLGLDADASPWEQLTRSEGRRQGDTIQIFPEPTVNGDGVVSCSFLVHGIRYVDNVDAVNKRLSALRVGDELRLVDEPSNQTNPRAILTTTVSRGRLGWVPDLLLDELHALREDPALSVAVQHVNGVDAPWHMRLLAGLRCAAPAKYKPFSGPKWQLMTQ